MVINKELLEKRKKISQHRPKFVRQESWRYGRLAENWRKPQGKDNKMRLQVSGVPQLVKVGYRGPKVVRGLHPSGYVDNLIYNTNDLLSLDSKKDAVRIGRIVGKLKKKQILTKAAELGLKVLNPGKDSKLQNKSQIKEKDSKLQNKSQIKEKDSKLQNKSQIKEKDSKLQNKSQIKENE